MALEGKHDINGGLHFLLVTDNGELGAHSGRSKSFVACLVCRKILHWSTTSPETWVKEHLAGKKAAYEEDRSGDWGKDPPDPQVVRRAALTEALEAVQKGDGDSTWWYVEQIERLLEQPD